MENGVDHFEWAPDSKHIALTAESPETKAMKDRKESFGEYHVFHADYSMPHLWLLILPATDPAGTLAPVAEPKLLTPGDALSIESFSISPDGTKIAFSAQRGPDLVSSATSTIYTVNIADSAVHKLVDSPGPHRNPQWSPDGTQIAFQTSAGEKFYYYTNGKIAVIPATGGTPKVLTANFDEDPDLLRWTPDGIYFEALHKMSSHLYLLDPAKGTSVEFTVPSTEVAQTFTFSNDFRKVSYRGTGTNQFAEIYTAALPSPASPQPTHPRGPAASRI